MSVDSLRSIQDNYAQYSDMFEGKSNDTISMETFYKLLMAEMSNQDPMEPMSNTEFISQMASFTSLKSQQDALYYNNANYAQSLVGKTVTVAKVSGKSSSDDVSMKSGIVTSMSLQNGEFNVKVNGENYALANIMEVLPSSNPYAVTGDDGTFATSLIGKQVTVESTNNEGKVIYETGVVSHIEIKDSEVSVIVNELSYPVASVLKVEEKPVEATDETDVETELSPANLSALSSASALIGKTVSVSVKVESEDEEYEESEYIISGIVDRVQVENGKVYLIINDEEYLMSSIVSVENTNEKTTNATENNNTTDETQNNGATDETQNNGVTDETQNNGATDETQNNGTTNETQNSGTTDETQNNGTTDETQNNGTTNETQNNGETGENHDSDITDNTQNNEEILTPQYDDTEELKSLFA